jgi:hypothetical protein
MASTSLAFSTVLKADRSPTSRASRSPQARYPSRCSSSFSVSERFFVSVIASSSALDTSGQSSAGREKNVPRWSQSTRSRFLAGRNWGEETRSCAKLLIDEPPGPPWAIKSGSGARFSASLLIITVASRMAGPVGSVCRRGTVTKPHSTSRPSVLI